MHVNSTDVDHGITITTSPCEDGVPFTWPWRAQCLCGWQSPAVPTRSHAAAEGAAHVAADSGAPAPQAPERHRLISAAELVESQMVTEATLRSWRLENIGPRSIRLAGRIVYRSHEVQAWLADGEQSPSYFDRVAAAVAERIRERGVVLDADELATVAMALDCSPSDLLPPHLTSDEQVKGGRVAENGLIWDDERVTVRRLPWMTDRQWQFVSQQMTAFLEAEGLIRDEVAR